MTTPAPAHPLAGLRSPSPDFFHVDALLSDDERNVRDRVRAFAEREVRPGAGDAWDRAEFQAQCVAPLGALGVVGGTVEGYGCPSLTSVAYGLATQEIARVDSSFATFFGVHSGLAMGTIALCGTDGQKERWLPRMAACDLVGAFALTEPGHGSDAARMETGARRDGDAYVLNGAKRWIGNGTICGIAGFVVECPNPGFEATLIEGKMSKRASIQADIVLRDCRVPIGNRLRLGGFRTIADILSRTRHNVAWAAIGEAMACYEVAHAYALKREQFGKPIAAHQLVQAKLVHMLGEITKAQLFALQLGRLKDRGEATPGMTALAKSSNAAMARSVAATAREILGGNGILAEFDVMRHLCDIESVYTYEGTDDINTLVVGREITGLSAFM
ncbi:MAG: acyl-CoA dehydrogenase family protein [Thermomicrobiales bacterium]